MPDEDQIVTEFKKRYPVYKDWSEESILRNLEEPEKFRAAFPEYRSKDKWSDDSLRKNVTERYTARYAKPKLGLLGDIPKRLGAVAEKFPIGAVTGFEEYTPPLETTKRALRVAQTPAIPVGSLLRNYIQSSPNYDPLRKQLVKKGEGPFINASVNTLVGLAQVGADVVEGLSTPANVAILGSLAVAPEVGVPAFVSRLVAAGFSLTQAKAAADKIVSAYEKHRQGDDIGAGQDAADSVVQATFAILAGHSAAHPNVAKLGIKSAWTEFYKKNGLPENLAEQAAERDAQMGKQPPPVAHTEEQVRGMEAQERASMARRQARVMPARVPEAIPPPAALPAKPEEKPKPPLPTAPERTPGRLTGAPALALEPSADRPAFIEDELRARAKAEGVPEPKQVEPPSPEVVKRLREQRAQERGDLDMIRGSWDQIANTLSPATRAPVAARVRLRKAAAQIAADDERAAKALNAYKAMFDRAKLPVEASLDFIDRYETGGTFVDSKHQQLANLWRNLQSTTWREVMKREGMDRFIEDYFPHLFREKVEGWRKVFGRRPLLGPRTWRFKRQFPTVKEALTAAQEQGQVLEPAYDNPVKYMTEKLHEMNKYIAMYDFVEEMKELGILQFQWANLRPPEGMAKIEDPVGTMYGPPALTKTLREAHDEVMFNQINQFARSLGIDHIRKVKLRGGPTVWGYTIKGTDRVWTKFAGPEEVLTHELGHQLHFRYPELDALIKDPATREELRRLADMRYEGRKPEEVSAYYRGYVRIGTEKIANLIHAYVHIRERARSVAPNAIGRLEQIIAAHDELRPLSEIKPGLTLGAQEVKEQIPLPGQLIMGHYYAPEPAARLINNYLKPGLQGKPLYQLFHRPANFLNQFQLGGFSMFHFTFTGLDAANSEFALGLQRIARGLEQKSPRTVLKGIGSLAKGNIVVAPFEAYYRGSKVLREFYGKPQGQFYADTVNRLIEGGGRVKMDQFYYNSSIESFMTAWHRGNSPAVALNAIPAAVEALAYPVMQRWVPRIKLGVFSKLAEEELAKLGPNASLLEQGDALRKAWDSTDDRLGQLVYDNLGWNRVLKDLGFLMVRSLGWNLGTWRQIGGGYLDIGKVIATRGKSGLSAKAAYTVALPIVLGMHGAILMKLMSGKWPTTMLDLMYPQTGKKKEDGSDERLSFPSYNKDQLSYFSGFRLGTGRGLEQFGRTLSHKQNPELAMISEMLLNRDFYGVEIRNEDDPIIQQAKQLAEYVGGSFEPFWTRYARQRELAEGELTATNVIESMFGIMPAPHFAVRDAGEALAADYLAKKHPAVLSKEQAERARTRGQLIRQFRAHHPDAGKNLGEAMREKKITLWDRQDIRRSARMSPIELMVERLSLEQGLNVYEKTSPENKQKLKRVLRGKLHQARGHPELNEKVKRVFPNLSEQEIENYTPSPSTEEDNLGEVPIRSPFQSAVPGPP